MATTTIINRLARFFGYVPTARAATELHETRDGFYAVNEALYDGTVYSTNYNRGYLENILTTYVGPTYCDVNRFAIYPYFMPFKEIVDTYLNIFPGTWGQELRPVAVSEDRELNPRLVPVLARIWKDSGFDTQKQTLVRWGANYGTVGIRIATRPAVDGDARRPVLQVDHPRKLFNFEEDAEGNVTAVVLKWFKQVNRGTLVDPKWESAEVVELISKEEFSRTIDGVQEIPDAERENTLGFCPYVIHRHKDNGTAYGDWAYKGSEAVVHRINWHMTRQGKSIDRHQFPKWFGAGAGDKPATVDMGDTKMSWVKLHPDSPAPLLQAVVADIDQKAATEYSLDLRNELRGRQPELNLNDLKLIANTSGETLEQVKSPTAQVIKAVRPGYDHSLIRAMQMAASVGVFYGSVDLLTGFGPEGADKAFKNGLEDFAFAERPALPETPQQRITNAQADVADRKEKFNLAAAAQKIVNEPAEVLKLAGYSEADAARLAAIQPPSTPGTPPANGSSTSPRVAALLARMG